MRNKIGAHTPNYSNEIGQRDRKTESYRVAQTTISKWGKSLMVVSSYDEVEEFDLKPLINEFTEYVEYYLDIISEKALKSLF